jgi:NAD(P)-dependent dehydrogenase (short-subunit alcohol dehydrogenase family)
MKLKDQMAIVTGAGRNIGEQIARLFAAEGAKVAIVDLDRPRGEAVAAAIKAGGGEAEMFIADVAKYRRHVQAASSLTRAQTSILKCSALQSVHAKEQR